MPVGPDEDERAFVGSDDLRLADALDRKRKPGPCGSRLQRTCIGYVRAEPEQHEAPADEIEGRGAVGPPNVGRARSGPRGLHVDGGI